MDNKKLLYIKNRKVGDCSRCSLHKTRKNIVFGRGDSFADLMIVGEAPGESEDIKGIPFCGRSGDLLSKWLSFLGISEKNVYIANIVKCRPPKNRNPKQSETLKCSPFLHLQIMAIKPKVIVSLGRVSSCFLSNNSNSSLKSLREKKLFYNCQETNMKKVPLICSYHPSYVLRVEGGFKKSRKINSMVIKDLKKALNYINKVKE